jgi:hypothetical protein
MSQKKGLGRDVNSSVEKMEKLLECLKIFHDIPIKRGIHDNKIQDEIKDPLLKDLDKAQDIATSLHSIVENIIHQVKKIKPTETNNRFACQRVIHKFLTE